MNCLGYPRKILRETYKGLTYNSEVGGFPRVTPTSDNGIIRRVEWRNSTKLNITKAVEPRRLSLKSALYRTIHKYSFAIETSLSVECCLWNHSGLKRTLRRESKLKFEACHLKPLYFDFGFILASVMKVPIENLLSVG